MLYTFDVESRLVYGSHYNDVTLKLRCRCLSDQQILLYQLIVQIIVMCYVKLLRNRNRTDETSAYKLICEHRLLPVVSARPALSSLISLRLQGFSYPCSNILTGLEL